MIAATKVRWLWIAYLAASQMLKGAHIKFTRSEETWKDYLRLVELDDAINETFFV